MVPSRPRPQAGGGAMKLPIEVVPGAHPSRRFRWKQLVTSPLGTTLVEHVGALPTAVEDAVVALVNLATQLSEEVESLRRMVDGLAERVAGQSEVLARQAEESSPQGESGAQAESPNRVDGRSPRRGRK